MPRIAIVRKERCNPQGCGDYLCAKLCPINRKGEPCIRKEAKAVIDESLCIGCDICVNRCPFEAISIINLPEELAKQPVHRYGRNGFHLYNLPMPVFGKVIGIVGKNGVGKSTAIKILSGVLKPNLGTDEEADFSKLLEYFKGSEAQNFFERIAQGKIKVSYKPQQIDLIPKNYQGKVQDLLNKVNETNKLDEVVGLLQLEKILDHDIEKISGGELQRVAIAATVLKKANLYVFDEPTSHLDIKQRIKVARFIRSLADEETSVLVVEHDLIILDYMTDLVHLMYGKEAVFGVVSQPKNSRAGINAYLEGYLKEENMRFRDHAISFQPRQLFKQSSQSVLASWSSLKKKLGSFQLESSEGNVFDDEVLGVLGENGIGKTSFVKILAKVLESDEGAPPEDLKVSYKPQYLESGSDDVVMSVLSQVTDIESSFFKANLLEPLQLQHLMMRKLNQLSGGELQRVSIALCLSRDADLYLLDEPSAYLDVEQRLIISNVIKNVMEVKSKSSMVVDHDLLFIDYLSNRLIVFGGVPAVKGTVKGPFSKVDGMNLFLRDLNLTFRRDPDSNRPRANKEGSRKDREQKEANQYYA
jgi:ATP-binding cassette subfamily E protein 1